MRGKAKWRRKLHVAAGSRPNWLTHSDIQWKPFVIEKIHINNVFGLQTHCDLSTILLFHMICLQPYTIPPSARTQCDCAPCAPYYTIKFIHITTKKTTVAQLSHDWNIFLDWSVQTVLPIGIDIDDREWRWTNISRICRIIIAWRADLSFFLVNDTCCRFVSK